jgi:hypothetical protein
MGKKSISTQLKNRTRMPALCSVRDARHIGIIYNATEYVSFEIIKNLVRDLANDSKTVSVLGYVNSKILNDNYLYRKGFDFFSRNELNWYYKPISPVVDEFVKEPFDLLINLSIEDHFPIRYIVTLSPATFKAGVYSADDSCLDLMIDMEKERQSMQSETGTQLNFLISQILHYLSILKK